MTGHQGAVLLAWGRDAYRGIPASFGPGLDVLKECTTVAQLIPAAIAGVGNYIAAASA